MATLRELRTRVASISNIQRVTNAMQMVAAAKMRRAQDAILAARPYAVQLDRVLRRLQGSVDTSQHPLLSERDGPRSLLVVVTADRGLCGGFNGNICRYALTELKQSDDVALITIGRKGRDFFRNRDFEITEDYPDVFRDLDFSQAVQIGRDLMKRFVSDEVDRVVLLFSEFRSVSQQIPMATQLLPIVPGEENEEESGLDYIFEPEPDGLLQELVPRQINMQIWRALLESNAGFYAAQMTAMDNATKNAGEIIEELTREMNKERQASITLELMDIVGGAEAVAQ